VIGATSLRSRRADPAVIFEQARKRRRRRRLVWLVVISLVLAASAGASLAIGGGRHDPVARGAAGRPAVTAKSGAGRLAIPAVQLAWVDDIGYLNVGDPATGAQQVGPPVDASQSAALVAAGGQLYWSDTNRNAAPIRDYDLATGKTRYLASGESVFASADGRHIYIVRNASSLIELRADGSGREAVLRLPAGWYVSANVYPWEGMVAGGILVYSSNEPDYLPTSAREGIWSPGTDHVRVLGRGLLTFGAYTPPGARQSLFVWVPPSQNPDSDFPLKITDTATMATVSVRSPLPYGFVSSGALAFSPDGSHMAVFVRLGPLGSDDMAELAIVDARTGTLRLVPAVTVYTTEDSFWALWLPGGQRLLAGAVNSSYMVDTKTLAAQPFSFFSSPDVGFTAVAVTAAAHSRS
jgi:hypothetical protein